MQPLTPTVKNIIKWSLIALPVILAVLFAIFDLQISQSIVNQESAFGLTLEALGTLIAPLIGTLACITLCVYFYKSPLVRKRRIYITLCFLIALGAMSYCGIELAAIPSIVTGLIIGFLIIAAVLVYFLYIYRKTAKQLAHLYAISLITIFYLLAVLASINLLKLMWGRVRYRDLQDVAEFSRFYVVQGFNGHVSFPSGHTANAACLYAITLFVPLCKLKNPEAANTLDWKKITLYAIPIVWIIIMAVSRVMVGAHYASDVLFGALISVGLFYWVKHAVLSHMAKKLASSSQPEPEPKLQEKRSKK